MGGFFRTTILRIADVRMDGIQYFYDYLFILNQSECVESEIVAEMEISTYPHK